jgi:hypothetical protein
MLGMCRQIPGYPNPDLCWFVLLQSRTAVCRAAFFPDSSAPNDPHLPLDHSGDFASMTKNGGRNLGWLQKGMK